MCLPSFRVILLLEHETLEWSMIRPIVLVWGLFANIPLGKCGTIPSKTEPALLVISYDAFRPEYLNRKVTPNLNKFRKEGTSAQFMYNVFPTKTFVNHFTIATVSNRLLSIYGIVKIRIYSEIGKPFDEIIKKTFPIKI